MVNGSGGDKWWSDPVAVGATAAAAVSAVIALGFGLLDYADDREDEKKARAIDARAARHDIVATVLQMGDLDAEGGNANGRELLVLAADAEQLIDEFGDERNLTRWSTDSWRSTSPTRQIKWTAPRSWSTS